MIALQALGVRKAFGGVVALKGADFASTAHAVRRGVAVVAQELSLFPHHSVLDNLYPMREPRRSRFVDRGRMRELALPVLQDLGFTRPLHTPVARLTLSERQLVEIAKALVARPKALLLNEPTSALKAGDSAQLLDILRVLRDRQVGVVYVSHIWKR